MATTAELEDALRNAHAAGDTAAATKLADALVAAQGAAPAAAPKHAKNVYVKGVDDYNPTDDMNVVEQGLAGIGGGLKNAYLGAKGFAARRGLLGGTGGANSLSSLITGSDANSEAIKVAAEQAEKNKLDAPLTDTVAGAAGNFVGENLPYMLPGAGIAKGVSMIPKAMKFANTAKVAASLGGNAAAGAAQSAMAPTEDAGADDADRAMWGGIFGAGGDVAGRAVGKVVGGLAPRASKYAQSKIDDIKNSPVGEKMTLLASHLTDNGTVKDLSDAMSKVMILGRGINKAPIANKQALTELATDATGSPMSQLVSSDVDAMKQRLVNEGNVFRAGPDVPMDKVAGTTQDIIDKVSEHARATGGNMKPLERGLEDATPKASILIDPATGKPFPGPPKTLTANEVMDRRRAASDLAHGAFKTGDVTMAAKYAEYQNALDEALKDTIPQPKWVPGTRTAGMVKSPTAAAGPPPHPFDEWRQKWAAMEKVRNATDAGLTPQGHLQPGALEKQASLDVQQGGTGTKAGAVPTKNQAVDKLASALQARSPEITGGGNRALNTFLLTAGTGAAAAGMQKATDSPAATLATASAPLLAMLLLGTPWGGKQLTGNLKHQAEAALAARLLAQQGVQGTGIDVANK